MSGLPFKKKVIKIRRVVILRNMILKDFRCFFFSLNDIKDWTFIKKNKYTDKHLYLGRLLGKLLQCTLKGKRQVFLEAKSEQLNYLPVSEVHSGGSSFALFSILRVYSYMYKE